VLCSCEDKYESGRYALRISAFNLILEALQIASCEFKQPTGIIFHRNDPKQIKADYGGLEAVRQPAIIFLSRQDVIGSKHGELMQAACRSFELHVLGGRGGR